MRAWRPDVAGISEVFHAQIAGYAYPAHAHDTWTVLIVDAGAIEYDLDLHRCGASGADTVVILPPGVVHDGRPASGVNGFRKRNLYLHESFLPTGLVGAAVDRTTLHDPVLRGALSSLHDALEAGDDRLCAESALALINDRLVRHLVPSTSAPRRVEVQTAHRFRLLLDDGIARPMPLATAAALLDRSAAHLVRSFSRTYGVSPHAYLIGRRIEAARSLLLDGVPPAEVSTAVGFYDQAHFTRHFKRHTSTTPARYASRR